MGSVFKKRIAALAALFALVTQTASPALAANVRGRSVEELSFIAPKKTDAVMEDSDEAVTAVKKANVLFYLDTSLAMGFSPKGFQPNVVQLPPAEMMWARYSSANWVKTYDDYGYGSHAGAARTDAEKEAAAIAAMNDAMKWSTFGAGMLPTADGKSVGATTSGRPRYPYDTTGRNSLNNLYGREIDESNNFRYDAGWTLARIMEENADRYYFPFAGETGGEDPLIAMYGKEAGMKTFPDLFKMETSFHDWHKKMILDGDWHAASTETRSYRDEWGDTLSYKVATDSDPRYTYDYASELSKAAGRPLPYALVFKDPRYWTDEGMRRLMASGGPKSHDLVPNDSRMYRMKVALWNVLDDQSNFENMRFAIATPYQSDIIDNSLTASYSTRIAPYGNRTARPDEQDPNGSAPADDLKNYTEGVLDYTVTGQSSSMQGINSTIPAVWGNLQTSLAFPTNAYSEEEAGFNGIPLNTRQEIFMLESRAYLRLPFAEYTDIWSTERGRVSHLNKFRMWIDGVEDIEDSQGEMGEERKGIASFYPFANPELRPSGVTNHAYAIFPDPARYTSPAAGTASWGDTWFSLGRHAKQGGALYAQYYRNFFEVTPFLQPAGQDYAWDSGEAAGSIRDFFSPPKDWRAPSPSGGDRYPTASVLDLAPIQFPVQDPCNDNWVIMVTSATELLKGQTYEPAEALKLLHDSTYVMPRNYSPADDDEFRTCGCNKKDYTSSRYPDAPDYIRNKKVTVCQTDPNDPTRVKGVSEVQLDKPIRTIVIGLITNPGNDADATTRAQYRQAVKQLVRMGRAGYGHEPDCAKRRYTYAGNIDSNFDAVEARLKQELLICETAGDVTRAIEKALRDIHSDMGTNKDRTSKNSVIEGPSIETGEKDGKFDLFTTTYRINRLDQWRGELVRYAAVKEGAEMTVTNMGGLNDYIQRRTRGDGADGRRDIQFWSPSRQAFVPLTQAETRDDSEFSRMTGLKSESFRADGRQWYTGDKHVTTPAEAYRKWLNGVDFYFGQTGDVNLNDTDFERDMNNMLADFGQSGIALTGPPTPIASLPGFERWARGKADQKTMLYTQTNDGVFHVIDPGFNIPEQNRRLSESKALLLPPVLVPARLASTKITGEKTDGRYAWTNVNISLKDDTQRTMKRSDPSFTMDGQLQLRYFNMEDYGRTEGDKWGAFVLGTLGRGGNGLYMLDVTEPESPSFMWYREMMIKGKGTSSAAGNKAVVSEIEWNAEDRDIDRVTTFEESIDWASLDPSAARGAPGYIGYKQLGYNIPRPAMGVVGTMAEESDKQNLRNVVIVPGGIKSKLTKDSAGLEQYNGGEGAAIYILDPANGNILRVFNSRSLAANTAMTGVGTTKPLMGMITSEPALYRSDASQYITSRAFMVDDLGRVMMVNFAGAGADSSREPNDWKVSVAASLQRARNAVDGNYSVPHGLAVTKKRQENALWAAGGTADVGTLGHDSDDGRAMSDYEAKLYNKSQMIFSFTLDTNDMDSGEVQYRGEDWKELDGSDNSSLLLPDDISGGKKGWWSPLDPEDATYFAEYTTTTPVIVDNKLFIGTFKALKLNKRADGSCSVMNIDGESRLYAVDTETGAGVLWGGASSGGFDKSISFSGIKITGLTLSEQGGRTTLIVTYDTFSDANDVGAQADKQDGKINRVKSTDGEDINALTIDLIRTPDATFPKGAGILDFWLMKPEQ